MREWRGSKAFNPSHILSFFLLFLYAKKKHSWDLLVRSALIENHCSYFFFVRTHLQHSLLFLRYEWLLLVFVCIGRDIPSANKILQDVVNNIVEEYLQPHVNHLIPKEDWSSSKERWSNFGWFTTKGQVWWHLSLEWDDATTDLKGERLLKDNRKLQFTTRIDSH